jgi:hypothetical protein
MSATTYPATEMRSLLRLGASAVFLVAILLAGSLVLWVGIPLAWLWIGSQIQDATDSLGTAVAAMLVGVVVSIVLWLPVLSWLSERYRRERAARGLEDTGHFALEVTLVLSAGIALVGFVGWFLLFSGAAPLPFVGSHG